LALDKCSYLRNKKGAKRKTFFEIEITEIEKRKRNIKNEGENAQA
jgi:hypothetical protein